MTNPNWYCYLDTLPKKFMDIMSKNEGEHGDIIQEFISCRLFGCKAPSEPSKRERYEAIVLLPITLEQV